MIVHRRGGYVVRLQSRSRMLESMGYGCQQQVPSIDVGGPPCVFEGHGLKPEEAFRSVSTPDFRWISPLSTDP